MELPHKLTLPCFIFLTTQAGLRISTLLPCAGTLGPGVIGPIRQHIGNIDIDVLLFFDLCRRQKRQLISWPMRVGRYPSLAALLPLPVLFPGWTNPRFTTTTLTRPNGYISK